MLLGDNVPLVNTWPVGFRCADHFCNKYNCKTPVCPPCRKSYFASIGIHETMEEAALRENMTFNMLIIKDMDRNIGHALDNQPTHLHPILFHQ